MKLSLSLLLPLAALFLTGCASTSVTQTWKTSNPPSGPVQKVAVIAVDQRGLARIGFENRFVRELKARGQEAMPTHDLLALPDIKADKEAAAAKLKAAAAKIKRRKTSRTTLLMAFSFFRAFRIDKVGCT